LSDCVQPPLAALRLDALGSVHQTKSRPRVSVVKVLCLTPSDGKSRILYYIYYYTPPVQPLVTKRPH
jgi:hypothetical protein